MESSDLSFNTAQSLQVRLLRPRVDSNGFSSTAAYGASTLGALPLTVTGLLCNSFLHSHSFLSLYPPPLSVNSAGLHRNQAYALPSYRNDSSRHHNQVQALSRNPTLSRLALGPQIHVISDDEIEALLTEHQKQFAKAMQKRMHDGEECRRPVPSGTSR